MWSEGCLSALADAFRSVRCDSRMVVVDNANVGDLCAWICDRVPLIQTLYSNQEPVGNLEKSVFAAGRDQWYSGRVMALNPQRCRPMSLTTERFLKSFGGRRWDLVVNRKSFESLDEGIAWASPWVPVTTGLIAFLVGDRFFTIAGKHPIPERTPPVRSDKVIDQSPGRSADINNMPMYEVSS